MRYILQFGIGVTISAVGIGVMGWWNLAAVFAGAVLVAIALKKWIVDHTDYPAVEEETTTATNPIYYDAPCEFCAGKGWSSQMVKNITGAHELKVNPCPRCEGTGKKVEYEPTS